MLWKGDFNCHHPMWDEARNLHLFTMANLNTAQILIDLLVTYDMQMALEVEIPALEAKATKNYT